MFLTRLHSINTLQVFLHPARRATLSMRLKNETMGALTCCLIDPLRGEISRVWVDKSTFLWAFNFSTADLRPGDYWVVIRQEGYTAMQKLVIA